MKKLVVDKIRTAISQDIVTKQLAAAHGRNLVINCPIMINGNDAIERACANDGNVIAAMKHIISVLPEPKEIWLSALAMVVAVELTGTQAKAAELLGVDRTRFGSRLAYAEKVKAIQDGEVTFGEGT